ncbi:MAG: type II toxin-antitoxin system RelE/ParE family toxin [Syntrophales bacterium]
MSYRILWNTKALDSLKELDKPVRKRIFDKVNDYVSQDPTNIGKPLKEKLSGFWRYRFGDYRIIYTVDLEKQVITVLEAGHRKDIYKK